MARLRARAVLVAAVLVAAACTSAAGSSSGPPTSPEALLDRMVLTVTESTEQDEVQAACVLMSHSKGLSGCEGKARKAVVKIYDPSGGQEGGGAPVAWLVEERDLAHWAARAQSGEGPPGGGGSSGFVLTDEAEVGARPLSLSPAAKFPHAGMAPYPAGDYAWNPSGRGMLMGGKLPPIFLASPDRSTELRRMAEHNAARGYRHPLYVADSSFEMWAAGQANSSACLAAHTCLPVGGYTAAATLPPGPSDATPGECVLVVSHLDSSSLFHGASKGALSALSGAVASLSAFEALAKALRDHAAQGGELQRRVAFAVLASEDWGLSGSRRLAAELANGTTVVGCGAADIAHVVEVGEIGSAEQGVMYLHQTPGATGEVRAAFLAAAAEMGGSVEVRDPSQGAPGIPPGPLMTFQQRGFAGASLTDFDGSIRNAYLSSFLDGESNAEASAAARAAELAARALFRLATNATAPAGAVDSSAVNATASALWQCLASSDPGMQCPLAQQTTETAMRSAAMYAGVLSPGGPPRDAQHPTDKSDVQRFAWSFLASRSPGLTEAQVGALPRCTFPAGEGKQACAEPWQQCVMWRGETNGVGEAGGALNGRCVNATAAYVPAWSASLVFDERAGWRVEAKTAADREDEVWAESYWPSESPSARVYLVEGHAYGLTVLLAGLAATVASWAASRKCRSAAERRLKDS